MTTQRQDTSMPDVLSEADCAALLQRVASFARGGGDTHVTVESTWAGSVRWGRNLINQMGDIRGNFIELDRQIGSLPGTTFLNTIDDTELEAAVRRAEHLQRVRVAARRSPPVTRYPQEPMSHPKIWFDATYHLDADQRAEIVRTAIAPAAQAGMLSAGFLQVRAVALCLEGTSVVSRTLYYRWTTAQFSVTVRDPQGTGSGWAGVDWNDWSRVDAAHLAAVALDKCLRARNPATIEPDRYTTILEPQAVGDLWDPMFDIFVGGRMSRRNAEQGHGPFAGSQRGTTKIGERVLDERITITSDPMDPDLGFPPFYFSSSIYNPITYVAQGILRTLEYSLVEAADRYHELRGQEGSGAFRMSGGTTSIDEMIQTTTRGLLVTRFADVRVVDETSVLCTGYTRDGVWLIEHGKITKPVKNFRFTESPLLAFNQVEQLGVPQRIFHPLQAPGRPTDVPVVVPPAKIRDFSFTALAGAI